MSLVDYQSSSEDSDAEVESEKSTSIPSSTSKNKEPVRISVPSVDQFEEEEESPSKKVKLKGSCGLLSMLPAPKHSGFSGKTPMLIPYSLKKEKCVPSKKSGTSESPSITKSKKPVVNQTDVSENKTCEEVGPSSDYFSLQDSSEQTSVNIAVPSTSITVPHDTVSNNNSPFCTKTADTVADQNVVHSSVNSALKFDNSVLNDKIYDVFNASSSTYPAGENEQISATGSSTETEFQAENPEIDIKNDERFLRLQSKKMRGIEDVNIIDISADSLVASKTEWYTKVISEEKKVSHSRKRNDMPTQLQKRKHQITYLAFQAKERELDLKNQWAQNALTKKQTQSKYGF